MKNNNKSSNQSESVSHFSPHNIFRSLGNVANSRNYYFGMGRSKKFGIAFLRSFWSTISNKEATKRAFQRKIHLYREPTLDQNVNKNAWRPAVFHL